MSEELSKVEKLETKSIFGELLQNWIKYLIALIAFILGVVAPYYDIKTEIALIKQNHSAHIETMQRNIETNIGEIKELNEQQVELMKIIAEHSVRITNLEK